MSDFSAGGAYERFGSARWAEVSEIKRAGLFAADGLPIGYINRHQMRLDTDAPKITIAGAGSGKARDRLVETLCTPSQEAFAVLDPRGELFSTSIYRLAEQGIRAYPWCPMRTLGIIGQPCNPLDLLDINDLNFHADVQAIMSGLIPASGGGGNAEYFELRAQEWCGSIIKSQVERYGRVSFPRLYHVLNLIETDQNKWADEIEAMTRSRFDDVRRNGNEMIIKQQDVPKEFSGILGSIFAKLAWLNDPTLRAALEDGFSLSTLSEDGPVSRVHFIVPAEFLSIWAPLIRVMFTTIMLYKSRRPQARRVNFIVDEAGQLGRFETLLAAFTYGRGAGVSAWAFFQDAGQISRNFDREALQSYLGSSALRQFFGVRDYETAKVISEMIGEATFAYEDAGAQDRARMARQAQAQSVLFGGDPFEAAREFAHASRAAKRQTHVRRPLITPSEVLALPEDEQILFISGRDLPPIRAKKYPYFTLRGYAGRYLPNPYHPPTDRVIVQGRLGPKMLHVYKRNVPYKYRDFPQYASGSALEIEGYPLD